MMVIMVLPVSSPSTLAAPTSPLPSPLLSSPTDAYRLSRDNMGTRHYHITPPSSHPCPCHNGGATVITTPALAKPPTLRYGIQHHHYII
ncbi:hypothetical protein E2C01_102270 [Portunus trituberculatus]|uniref:Secreted protein n=1 Tax=Portunus trituberculatus TaxID=210409 RepID=A0A5B7KI05_PORTR|nr:hypothetical protein [Portunus trituberculatus]